MGTKYKAGFGLQTYDSQAYAFFNLNGQYSRLEFDVGHVDGSDMRKRDLIVSLDGEKQDTIAVNPDMMLTHYSFPVSEINQLKVELRYITGYGGGNAKYGIVNAKLYS